MRIGIDVGGTNTDAVLMQGRELLAAVKCATTPDVSSGILQGLTELLAEAQVEPNAITAVMIGTTHFTNAVIERKQLAKTAVVRLGLPATKTLPPLVDWPPDLADLVGVQRHLAHGGYEFNGRLISPLDHAELRTIAAQIRDAGITAVALTSVFSPINADIEQEAASIIAPLLADDATITLSHEIGQIGLLERENATVLNACLRPLAQRTVAAFQQALAQQQIAAPLYISQNDGTLLSAERVTRFPVLTFASGPTNSMRGAAFLSGVADGVVVDIGGTTTDIGVLNNGFPRPAALAVDIGGVRTNFRMPDLYSFGLGGGSLVHFDPLTIGPESVGYRLTAQARLFGGEQWTASDVAVAAGLAEFGDKERVTGLEGAILAEAVGKMRGMVETAVDRMKTSTDPVPVVLVGGGSILVGDVLAGVSQLIRPNHYAVANAVGAALTQVGGEVDRIVALEKIGRAAALEAAKAEAQEKAIAAGATPESVTIHTLETIPLSYLPGNATRIQVKAVGDLTL
ncbi:MAG: hydantoinase/oxoprolinase family protein [Chloroflexota bacterium]